MFKIQYFIIQSGVKLIGCVLQNVIIQIGKVLIDNPDFIITNNFFLVLKIYSLNNAKKFK